MPQPSSPDWSPPLADTAPAAPPNPQLRQGGWAAPNSDDMEASKLEAKRQQNAVPVVQKDAGYWSQVNNSQYGSTWDNVKGDAKFMGREAAIAARGAVQGVESLPLMALDAGVGATNLVKKGLSKMGVISNPQYMDLPSQTNDQAITSLGVPAPQNAGERGLEMTAGVLAGSRLPQGAMEQAPGQALAPNTTVPLQGQTAGQVTGSPLLQSVESTLGRMPGGAPIRNTITTQKNNLATGVQGIVDNLAGGKGTTPYSVGTALDAGIKKGAQDLKDAGGAIFDYVDAKIPTNLQTKLPATQSLLNAFTKIDPNAPATSGLFKDPQVMNIQKAFQSDLTVPGTAAKPSSILGADGAPAFTTPATAATQKPGLPYQTIKGLITDLSQSIDWSPLNGDAVNGAKKALYGAMRNDLNASASSVSPQLEAEVKAANSNWSDTKDRLTALTNAVGGNGGAEQIFNRLVNGAKAGPSGLSNVMDVLSDSNQRLLAAGMLQKLGRSPGAMQNATGDAFDADTFFSNWGKMDPDAKDRLFGSLPQEYRKTMDTLVSNANTLKAYAKVLPNASNTASAAIWGISAERAITALFHGDFTTAGITAVGVPAATNLTARALTNPRVVRYLAQKTSPSKVLGAVGSIPPLSQGASQGPQQQRQAQPMQPSQPQSASQLPTD